MAVITASFIGALTTIVALFTLRLVEERRGARFVPEFRVRVDSFALVLKMRIIALAKEMHRLPGIGLLILRYFVHIAAKAAARFARKMESGAHELADRMTHKHRFRRRESTNAFLREVAEHKNGNAGKEEKVT